MGLIAKSLTLLVWTCLALPAAATCQTHPGSPDSTWVGQRIVMLKGLGAVHDPKDPARLKTSVGINIVSGVARQDGRQLWILSTSGSDSGWVDSSEARRLVEAIPYLDGLIRAEPAAWDPYLRRAEAEHALNQREAATLDYTKAIDLQSGEAFLYLRRGRHLWTLHACEKALSDFERAIRLVPTSSAQDYNLAAELYSLEAGVYAGCPDSAYRDPRKAVAAIDHAIALDSTRAGFFVILAGAQASSGDFEAAVAAMKRALASAQSPSYRREWQLQLDEYQRALSNSGKHPL